MERKLGGCLMDKPKSLLYQDGGSNLCLSLEDIGPGWRSTVSYTHLISFKAQFLQIGCTTLIDD